ncbi:hypothetical protein DL93DRAFT_2074393 [Clavulina sp. PMI_390]|nr:hypothetical protein DL93DRAFT_2074393 [Clavulina sp. PMI_390]
MSGNNPESPKQQPFPSNINEIIAASRTSSPTSTVHSTTARPTSFAASTHATTIFMGEGTPRHELLRSPRSDASFSSSPPPIASINQQPYLSLPPISSIHPLTSLELRIRWLEALVSGVPSGGGKPSDKLDRKTRDDLDAIRRAGLLKKAEDVQQQLDDVVQANSQLKRFMRNFDEYESILNPAFALAPTKNGSSSPSYEDMTDVELEALLKDMEPELRSADRDLREVQALDRRGVTGAGKLADYEPLQERMRALAKATQEDEARLAEIERRTTALLQRYSSHVSALSDLFIYWNDSVTDAEDFMTRVEKDNEERAKKDF